MDKHDLKESDNAALNEYIKETYTDKGLSEPSYKLRWLFAESKDFYMM